MPTSAPPRLVCSRGFDNQSKSIVQLLQFSNRSQPISGFVIKVTKPKLVDFYIFIHIGTFRN